MELLAPAGTSENFLAALEAGADAIYLGGKAFNARANAANFEIEELAEAVRLAHLLDVSVFVTVNILIGDAELNDLKEYLRELERINVDAIIVQDLALAELAKRVAPKLHLHASTQLTATNMGTVRFLERMGFTRVVLAREMSLEEIKTICREAKAEIEVFVHGALCVCYSGQCLMSSFIGGRSGNRGACAQPCRLPYELINGEGKVINTENEAYIMSPKDLNYSEHMAELLEAGVASFKVEGRMKKASYVKEVIGTYRQIIDRAGQTLAEDQEHLTAGFNRGFSTAYLENRSGREMITAVAPGNRGKRIGPSDEGPKKTVWQNLQEFGRKYDVHAYLDGQEGSESTLTLLMDDGTSVTVSGDYVVQRAHKTPTSHEKVSEQIGRLGTTVFRLASLYMPEEPFMWPSSVLNQMRRDAVARLEDILLAKHTKAMAEVLTRIEGAIAAEFKDRPSYKSMMVRAGKATHSVKAGSLPIVSVQLDEEWQLKPAIEAGAQKIIFGGDRLQRKPYNLDVYNRVVTICREHQIRCVLATPRIVRESEIEAYRPTLEAIITAKPNAISIHFLGALEWLQMMGYEGEVEGDSSLQLFNKEAVREAAELGLSSVVLSQEATLRQIAAIIRHSSLPIECVVHGLTELMISEYCVISSFAGTGCKANCPAPCLKDSYRLRDRLGEEFPLRTDPYCRMHIMNSRMLDMRAYIPDLVKRGIAILRIDGRQQSKEWLRDTIGAYRGILAHTLPVPPKNESLPITRGHYFKGIF